MKKLNNHGLTAVEVIICFSITAVIVISLFKTINNYNEKQYIESNKNQIKTYENTVTKSIQDDVLRNGGVFQLLESNITNNYDAAYDNGKIVVQFQFTNQKTAMLTIKFNTDDSSNDEEYILYETYNRDENTKEKFSLRDIHGVQFNEQRIDYDEDGGLLNIYVGIIDIDLGDKYSVLDLTLPLTKKWPTAYKK